MFLLCCPALMTSQFESTLHIVQIYIKLLLRRRGVWTRALLCWVIGLLALSTDEMSSYDTRFQIRPLGLTNTEIVIIQIHPSDLLRSQDSRTKNLLSVNEMMDLSESFFWDETIWYHFLTQLLNHKPRAIGITLHLPDNILNNKTTDTKTHVFYNSKIFWSTSKTQLERLSIPPFAKQNLSNVGVDDLTKDQDGITRRVYTDITEIPHLAERLAQNKFPNTVNKTVLINFNLDSKSFPHYSLSDLLQGEIPESALKDKIIIIGADTSFDSHLQTPIGRLSHPEVLAQVTHNLLQDQWIHRLPQIFYAIFLLCLTVLAAFIITRYPHSIAFLFLIWTTITIAAFSAWCFDTFYFWVPTFSPIIIFACSWIIFIGYQAALAERANIQLHQERKYLEELEQLKNNFVSLISHDLKTPIAKIQAVTNRLISENKGLSIEKDLVSLHSSSEELNRYIQSILKVLRVESRDFKIHREVADINDVIESATDTLKPLAQEKSIHINLTLEPMFSAEFDITLMKEVLINLIENAIKYSSPNTQISITSFEEDHQIHVEVADQGPGIAPEDIGTVFGKFVRGKDQDLKTKGSGLGLYLVKYFIELHGGKVSIKSQLGIGSTVSFTLPVTDDTQQTQIDPSTKKENA